ncbi:MAG: hypothetical protein PHP00_02905 [Thiotrichaceae bacterium]|nr:hypothetical protein [Thiotrichaceae bacterium]
MPEIKKTTLSVKTSTRVLWTLISGIFLIGVEWWVLENYEYAVGIHKSSYKGEAADNSLLALERFLTRHKIKLNKAENLEKILSKLQAQDVLLFNAEIENLNSQQLQRIQAWVKRGGQLWLRAPDADEASRKNWAEEVPFLQQFGVYRENFPYEQKFDPEARPAKTKKAMDLPDVPPVPSIVWNKEKFQLHFRESERLKFQTASLSSQQIGSDAQGMRVVQFKLEQGTVLFFSEWQWLENAMLGRYDHAYFFWKLLPQNVPAVWVTDFEVDKNINHPPKIFTEFSLLWLSALISLLFLVWHLGHRFGSILLPPDLARRRLLEHVEASGRFLWQHGQGAGLINEAREQLLQRIYQKYPDWQTLEPDAVAEALATLSALSAKEVHRALFSTARESSQQATQFTDTVRILAILRKAL